MISKQIERAATLIRNASSVFVTAGAGFGVDSGLPDFRGNEGFWNAYPAFRDKNLYVDLTMITTTTNNKQQTGALLTLQIHNGLMMIRNWLGRSTDIACLCIEKPCRTTDFEFCENWTRISSCSRQT